MAHGQRFRRQQLRRPGGAGLLALAVLLGLGIVTLAAMSVITPVEDASAAQTASSTVTATASVTATPRTASGAPALKSSPSPIVAATKSRQVEFTHFRGSAKTSKRGYREARDTAELPIIFQLYPSETKRNGIPVETIFVIGPEATGTRFMARSLSRLIDPGSSWNGELPGCVTHKASFGYVNIQHLSLPWGGLCDGNVRVLPSVDMCNREIPLPKRFFIDVTETLRRFPRAKAIVLRRDMAASMRSIADIHCRNATFAKMEYSLALKLIKDAFDTREIAQRLLRVDYEALGIEPETTWRQVFDFVGIQPPRGYTLPVFRQSRRSPLAQLASSQEA